MIVMPKNMPCHAEQQLIIFANCFLMSLIAVSNKTKVMKIFQRWALLIILLIINVELFDLNNWEFYVSAILSGIVCSPLFSKDFES